MKTDAREIGDSYEVDIDLSGFKKDEIQAELKDGILKLTMPKAEKKELPQSNFIAIK